MQVYILGSGLPVQGVLISSQVKVKLGFCQWLRNSWDCRLQHAQMETHADQSLDRFPASDIDGKPRTLEEVLSCFQDHSGEEEDT